LNYGERLDALDISKANKGTLCDLGKNWFDEQN